MQEQVDAEGVQFGQETNQVLQAAAEPIKDRATTSD
jgi:hypothetical protein